jgi:hypothetical protein
MMPALVRARRGASGIVILGIDAGWPDVRRLDPRDRYVA